VAVGGLVGPKVRVLVGVLVTVGVKLEVGVAVIDGETEYVGLR